MRARRRTWQVAGAVVAGALAGCASHVAEVTVAAPKVFGDDTVLRTLAEQRARLEELGPLEAGHVQERLSVEEHQLRDTRLGANLSDPFASPPGPPQALQPRRPVSPAPAPGPTLAGQVRQRVGVSQLRSSYGLLFEGDTRLLDRRSRALLLRFDLSFSNYVDLGSRRRFVVVEFRVRPRVRPGAKPIRFSVYLLSPDHEAILSHERFLARRTDRYAAQLLGSWGGIGVTGSRSGLDEERERFEALLETPLQFAIYDSRRREGERRFAFAFGPRRRLVKRSALNPRRWFGAVHELAYELQPGPRSCQALLVFEEVGDRSLDLEVTALCDGRLIGAEEVEVRAPRRRLETFALHSAPAPTLRRAHATPIDPRVPCHLLVTSGPRGPAFSTQSEVFLGPLALRGPHVRLLGRGRLAVRVPPSRALLALAASGAREVRAFVLTPDQLDHTFRVRLAEVDR